MNSNAYTFILQTSRGQRKIRSLGADESEARNNIKEWVEEDEKGSAVPVNIIEVGECVGVIKNFFIPRVDKT